MKIKHTLSYVLVLSLVLLYSSVGIAETSQATKDPASEPPDSKDNTEGTEDKLHSLESELFGLLVGKSEEDKRAYIKELQGMLNGLSIAFDVGTQASEEDEVTPTKEGTTAENTTTTATTATATATATATTTTTTTTTTTNIASEIPPVNTTAATNLTTQPPPLPATVKTETEIQPTTESVETTTTTKEGTTIPKITHKSPPVEKHFYKSPLFSFFLFSSVMTLFTVYFLYISRRKLKAYFYKNFASGRGNKFAYTRAPNLEDAMPSFAEVKQ